VKQEQREMRERERERAKEKLLLSFSSSSFLRVYLVVCHNCGLSSLPLVRFLSFILLRLANEDV